MDNPQACVLLTINDAPYGTERPYNALRLAQVLGKRDGVRARVFLLGDAVACARAGQKPPTGYYNIEVMLKAVLHQGGEVSTCGTCLDARGITEAELMEGVHRGSLDELATWTLEADRVLVF